MSSNFPRSPVDDPGGSFVEDTGCGPCNAPNLMAQGQANETIIFPTNSIDAGLFLCLQQPNAFVSLPESPFAKNLKSPPDIEEEIVVTLQLSDQQWAPIDELLFRGLRLGAIRAISETAKVGLRESRRAAYERHAVLRSTRLDEFVK